MAYAVSVSFQCDGKTSFQKHHISLTRSDFEKEGLEQAEDLLAKIINMRHKGRLFESVSLKQKRKACHVYGEKRTERTEAMYMVEGTSYVYPIYGMCNCLNI